MSTYNLHSSAKNDDLGFWGVQNIQSPSSSSSPPLSPNVEEETRLSDIYALAYEKLDNSKRNSGEICVFAGPMFSGKTTCLIGKIEQYKRANRKIVIIKHKDDARYSKNKVMTHRRMRDDDDDGDSISSLEIPDRLSVIADFSVKQLISSKVIEKCLDNDVIFVDEGQFFEDIVEFCEKMAEFGKIVFVATLDSNYLREDFGKVSELIRKATKKTFLSAVCFAQGCGKDAPFTRKRCDNGVETEIGGSELYYAACLKHYLDSTK